MLSARGCDATVGFILGFLKCSFLILPFSVFRVALFNSPVAFGQLCSSVGAPAKYLRTLPPEIVLDCLDYSLRNSPKDCKILVREPESIGHSRWASAFTGPTYGRIWDADVVENLIESVRGSSWHVPPARGINESDNSGLYASDRDMFVFLINDEQPIEVENARLGRGFFCWNSETGAATFGLTTFLYNYICGNHIVWGAEQVEGIRIVHRSRDLDRFYSDALPAINIFTENRAIGDKIKDSVASAIKKPIGNTVEKALEWFKDRPFTKREVVKGWDTGVSEGEDVTTLWGMVQGMTAYAREIPHIDARVNLERRAGALLR